MNRTRVIAGLQLAGAALCLGVIWPMWQSSLAYARNGPPGTDGGGMAVGSALVTTPMLLGGAVVLVLFAIRRLRRK
jgi:hypothetical protein